MLTIFEFCKVFKERKVSGFLGSQTQPQHNICNIQQFPFLNYFTRSLNSPVDVLLLVHGGRKSGYFFASNFRVTRFGSLRVWIFANGRWIGRPRMLRMRRKRSAQGRAGITSRMVSNVLLVKAAELLKRRRRRKHPMYCRIRDRQIERIQSSLQKLQNLVSFRMHSVVKSDSCLKPKTTAPGWMLLEPLDSSLS